MIKLGTEKKNLITLTALFSNSKMPKEVIKKKNKITIYPSKNKAYIYLGEEKSYNVESLQKAILKINQENEFGFNVKTKTFATKKMKLKDVVKVFVEDTIYNTSII